MCRFPAEWWWRYPFAGNVLPCGSLSWLSNAVTLSSMTSTIDRLRGRFLYKYHRFPGYLQAKRERLAARAKHAQWQIEGQWQRTLHGRVPLAGKTRDEIKRV